MRRFILSIAVALFSLLFSLPVSLPALGAGGNGGDLKKVDWSFSGPFGTYDKASLQRGLQVYREVCSVCHSLDYISFRNLADLGYNADEVKAIAAEYEIEDGPNDEGEMFIRQGLPADRFPAPFANDNAARTANGGSYPPDLSLIFKARANGANYLYSLLVSYGEPPSHLAIPDGMYYNEVYSGHMIAMPPPLYGDDVIYADGASSGIDSLSKDVVNFLAWTAEPALETRKRTGVGVIIFLILLVGMSYGAMRFTWADVKK